MSIEASNDPISELQPDSSPEDAREIAAALVRSGHMSTADANRHLAARGAVPLTEGSLEQIKAEKARLMQDHNFKKWTQNGDPDPDAIRALSELNGKIAKASGQLTDRTAAPASEYKFDTGSRPEFRGAPVEAITRFDENATAWAQELRLSPDLARYLVSAAHDADRVQDKGAFADEQEALFTRLMGSEQEANEVLNAAQKELNETTSRKIDLRQMLRSNGAESVVHLVHHLNALHLRS